MWPFVHIVLDLFAHLIHLSTALCFNRSFYRNIVNNKLVVLNFDGIT